MRISDGLWTLTAVFGMKTDPRPARTASAAALLALAAGLAGSMAACGHDGDATGPARDVVMAYDDNKATASLVFPSLTYESMMRVELPDGKLRPQRLRLQVAAPGTIAVTVYENDLLETPGRPLFELSRELVQEDVSNGKDGRWALADLRDRPALTGVVWLGMRKTAGEPALWTSAVVSGQSYLRDRDPKRAMGLLPVKRTPMVRLEFLP